VSVARDRAHRLEDLAASLHVPFSRLGETGGPRMVVDAVTELSLEEATTAHEDALPKLLAG
jgi:hypothetical protein